MREIIIKFLIQWRRYNCCSDCRTYCRRIVCEVKADDELNQGSRIGMIRFGSRADIYFENYDPLVKVNQKTIAGETLLAKK